MPESVRILYDKLYPSSIKVDSAHTSYHNGGGTGGSLTYDEEGLLYDAGTKWADGYESFDGTAWGEGSYHYSDPLPKGLKSISVDFKIHISCPGSASTSVWVTNSSGETIASGSSYVDLSAYATSKENLYLHVGGSSRCSENVGQGAIGTYCKINSISFSY